MDTRTSPAEELPTLYRSILDGLDELERLGLPAEAGRLRATATEIYSTSWDEAGRRGLVEVRRRIDRAAGRSLPPEPRSLRRALSPRTWVLARRSPSPGR